MYKVMGDNKYTGFSEVFRTTMYNLGTKKKKSKEVYKSWKCKGAAS